MQLFPSILDGWVPDKYTLRWAFSAANERQVFEAIRDDAHARSEGMEADSDEYWLTKVDGERKISVITIR